MTQAINFGAFKVQKSANERASQAGVARGQNFKLKYRKFITKKGGENKIDTVFTISNELFKELGLESYGIVQLNAPEGTEGGFIAVVANDDATMLKRTDKLKDGAPKGKKFKSTILEKALLEAGVIEDKEGITQFLDLEKVADTTELGNMTAIAIYSIVKGEGEDDDDENENEAAGTVEDAPQSDVDGSQDEASNIADAGTTNAPTSNDDF